MDAKFIDLKGKTLTKVFGLEKGNDTVYFETKEGNVYKMYHDQCCCECVAIDDVCGDIDDLLNHPILLSEEVISEENPSDVDFKFQDDSFTWTFYKLSTIKGDVTIRWYGESNGFYSERVDFEELVEK